MGRRQRVADERLMLCQRAASDRCARPAALWRARSRARAKPCHARHGSAANVPSSSGGTSRCSVPSLSGSLLLGWPRRGRDARSSRLGVMPRACEFRGHADKRLRVGRGVEREATVRRFPLLERPRDPAVSRILRLEALLSHAGGGDQPGHHRRHGRRAAAASIRGRSRREAARSRAGQCQDGHQQAVRESVARVEALPQRPLALAADARA